MTPPPSSPGHPQRLLLAAHRPGSPLPQSPPGPALLPGNKPRPPGLPGNKSRLLGLPGNKPRPLRLATGRSPSPAPGRRGWRARLLATPRAAPGDVSSPSALLKSGVPPPTPRNRGNQEWTGPHLLGDSERPPLTEARSARTCLHWAPPSWPEVRPARPETLPPARFSFRSTQRVSRLGPAPLLDPSASPREATPPGWRAGGGPRPLISHAPPVWPRPSAAICSFHLPRPPLPGLHWCPLRLAPLLSGPLLRSLLSGPPGSRSRPLSPRSDLGADPGDG